MLNTHAEECMRRLAKGYGVDECTVVSQWRLSHHLVPHKLFRSRSISAAASDVQPTVPPYKILLTLPVTTASVDRGFSKLSLVKTKLRSTMGQERLEALLLSSVEKDVLLELNNAELVACFASKTERRMLLA